MKKILILLATSLLIKLPIMGEGIMMNRRLPAPKTDSNTLLKSIKQRRSVRSFQNKPLTDDQISEILWSAQGITDSTRNFRAAPSAGAIYPITLYVVLPEGLYVYIPKDHKIQKLENDDLRIELSKAAWGQRPIISASMSVIITADYSKISVKYGDKAIRYTDMEAGHIAQNMHLVAVSLGLGSVPIGAFSENSAASILNLPENLTPIYIIPIGYPK